MSFFVYIHTCPNGKKYVGVTTQNNPEDRWREGEGYRNNKHFTSAIKKYGWDNIEHEYFKVSNANLMFYWEKILIYYHNTLDRDFGYNKTGGGEGPNGLKHSEETKKKMSLSHIGKKMPERSAEVRNHYAEAQIGKKLSEETKKKISESLKGRTSPTKGKKLSEEHKKKLSKACKGRKIPEETKRKMSEARKLYLENKRKIIHDKSIFNIRRHT